MTPGIPQQAQISIWEEISETVGPVRAFLRALRPERAIFRDIVAPYQGRAEHLWREVGAVFASEG